MIVGRVARAKGKKKNQQEMFHSLSDAAEIHQPDFSQFSWEQKKKLLRILPKQNTALLPNVCVYVCRRCDISTFLNNMMF